MRFIFSYIGKYRRQVSVTMGIKLLGTIVDDDLDRLDAIIDLIALDFKNLATRQLRGNLQSVVEQLETSMVNRQEYLRQNKRDDTKLTKLYDEENTRLTSIQAWRQTSTASRSGVNIFDNLDHTVLPLEAKNPYDNIAGAEGHVIDMDANKAAIEAFLYPED